MQTTWSTDGLIDAPEAARIEIAQSFTKWAG
jgi:hypothetical protein